MGGPERRGRSGTTLGLPPGRLKINFSRAIYTEPFRVVMRLSRSNAGGRRPTGRRAPRYLGAEDGHPSDPEIFERPPAGRVEAKQLP